MNSNPANGAQLGVLAVVVLKARHLPDRHTTHKQSPYVRIGLSNEMECTGIARHGGQVRRIVLLRRFSTDVNCLASILGRRTPISDLRGAERRE